jgi:hypothetical protein
MESKTMLLQHLQEVEKHVALGEHRIAEQRARIDELTRDGHDVRWAVELLATFEEMQHLHVEDRERLRSELVLATERTSRVS